MASNRKVFEEFNVNWERHNPFQNLNYHFSLVERLENEANEEMKKYQKGSAVPDWPILYYNVALNSIVSSFEFFFRELVLNEYILNTTQKAKYYDHLNGKFKSGIGNFQNYDSINNLLNIEFSIDIESELDDLEIEWFKYILAIRHLQTHNGGIVDKKFVDLINSFTKLSVTGYSIGSWLGVNNKIISNAKKIITKISKLIEREVSKLDKSVIDILFK